MAIYPGAIERLIPHYNKRRMAAYNRLMLHVAVSESSSLYNLFKNPSFGACSHFYVRKNGTVEQYIDTKYQSAAEVDASDASISIETQGGVRNANGEEWTDAQVARIADIERWVRKTHGIANKLAVSSRYGVESQGVAWHRQGVISSPQGLPGYRKIGSRSVYMVWSGAVGKACPGTAKINQIPEIHALAQTHGSKPIPKPSTGSGSGGSPKPTKRNPSGRPLLAVDGLKGAATIEELQHVFGTEPDGVISIPYSNLTAAIQRKLNELGYGLDVDGAGLYTNVDSANTQPSNTNKALQTAMGMPVVDGIWSQPSAGVAEMQRRLNRGTFLKSLKKAPAGWKKGKPAKPKKPAVPVTQKKSTSGAGVLKQGSKGAAVGKWQAWLNSTFPAYSNLVEDGLYGGATKAVTLEFQRRARGDGTYHGALDGIRGAGTIAAAKKYGWK